MFELAIRHYVQNVLKTYAAVQSLSPVQLFATPWTAARQAFLSFTLSQSLSELTSIELVMPSNHLVRCRPLLLLPSISTSIRVADYIFQRWPQQHIPLSPYARPTMWSWCCSVERWEPTCPPQPARGLCSGSDAARIPRPSQKRPHCFYRCSRGTQAFGALSCHVRGLAALKWQARDDMQMEKPGGFQLFPPQGWNSSPPSTTWLSKSLQKSPASPANVKWNRNKPP